MFSNRTSWPRHPNRLACALAELKASAADVLDLTESNPTRCGLSPRSIEALDALRDPRALDHQPDPRGAKTAREAIAAYYSERGLEVPLENIFLTTSTSEAYGFLFRLLANPGDQILVPQPSYPLLDFLATLNDCALTPYPLVYDDGWQMDLHELEKKFAANVRAAVVVHPNNPTGSYVKPAELVKLAELSVEWQCALIADEVFSDYAIEPSAPALRTLAQASDALTFTLSGLSKVSALPQMKLGWIVVSGPKEEVAEACARLELIADTYLSVSAPLACAMPHWLAMRREVQPRIAQRIKQNVGLLSARFAPPTIITWLRAEGGWYAILKLPSLKSDEDWAVELLTRDTVYVHPGHFFDMPWDGHLVVSLLPEPAIFEDGIRRIEARVAVP